MPSPNTNAYIFNYAFVPELKLGKAIFIYYLDAMKTRKFVKLYGFSLERLKCHLGYNTSTEYAML